MSKNDPRWALESQIWVREAEEVFINTQPQISQIVALLLHHHFINIIKKRKNIDSHDLLELK